MTPDEYRKLFADPHESIGGIKEADTRAGRALAFALDIRKFEVELYWKRAAYFWAFIGAAFAGYALTYKTAADHEPWLSLIFSALGMVFSFAWYLVNRGGKFWQNNWEQHVDLLEDMTIGPLYKVVAVQSESNPLTASGQFSVTKINQMLSLFVTFIWMLLLGKSLGPVNWNFPFDMIKVITILIAFSAIFCLWKFGRTETGKEEQKLLHRSFEIQT